MLNEYKTLVNYIKLHKISLEQDQQEVQIKLDLIEDMNSWEYREQEIMDISLTGQIMALSHIIEYANELEGNNARASR